jgi:hypothetical protein
MFGFNRKPKKPLSAVEQREKDRADEYARVGADTYAKQMLHEDRKMKLGAGYRERDSGTWKEAERYMKKHGLEPDEPEPSGWAWG